MNTNKEFIHNLIAKIRSPQNEYLSAKIGLSAFDVGFLFYLADEVIFMNNGIRSLILSRLGAITFFSLLGLDGFIVMIRKELHQIVIIRGKPAIFYGLIWCIFLWTLALQNIFLLLNDFVKTLL